MPNNMNNDLSIHMTPKSPFGGFRGLLLGLAAAALFVSCTREKDLHKPDAPQQAVQFAATLPTRTTNGGDDWVVGDGVGIYMLTVGGAIAGNTITGAGNVRYNISDATTGALAPDAAANTIYFPRTGNVDFVAYYPYSTAIAADGKYTISLTNQSNLAAVDVLTAKATNIASSTATPIPFAFTHAMSKITLNLKAGVYVNPADVAAITGVNLSSTPGSVVIDLNDGTFTPGGTSNIVLQKATTATADYDAIFTAIVAPHAGTAGRKLSTVIGRKTFTWDIPAGDAFTAGANYTYEANPKDDKDKNYRITWDAANGRYILTDDPTDAGLYFKFGSVVGAYSGHHANQTLPATNVDPFDAGDIAWSPVTISGTGAAGWATVPSYVAADYSLTPNTVTPLVYHNATNVKAGKGDPCRLVGLDLAAIKSKADAGTLTDTDIDNGTWRLPTVAENRTFTGQTADITFTAHWTTLSGSSVIGGMFPNITDGSAATFLPAAGWRHNITGLVSSYRVSGDYWSNMPGSGNAIAQDMNFTSTYVMIYEYSFSYGISVRCVRQ